MTAFAIFGHLKFGDSSVRSMYLMLPFMFSIRVSNEALDTFEPLLYILLYARDSVIRFLTKLLHLLYQ